MNNLIVGIHFDDIEFGCEGALAWQVAKRDTVYTYSNFRRVLLILKKETQIAHKWHLTKKNGLLF